MNDKNIKKYYAKLLIEAILKSILSGLMFGFVASMFFALLFIALSFPGSLITIIIGASVFIISSILLFFFKFKPDTKFVARRVDQIGLEERVITMLEMEGKENSLIIEKQKADTEIILNDTPSKSLKFNPFKKIIGLLLLIMTFSIGSIVVLSTTVDAVYSKKYLVTFHSLGGTSVASQEIDGGRKIVIPDDPTKESYRFVHWYEIYENDPFDFNKVVVKDTNLFALWEEKTEEDINIEKLIENLRNIVNRAEVSNTLKTDLHALIDQLELDLLLETTLFGKLAKIEEARDEILRRIQEEIDSLKEDIIFIGETLKYFDTTYNLGEAVLTKDSEILAFAIDDLIETLTSLEGEEKINALLQTADDIEEALELSNEENDKLREILQDLADYLRWLARIIEDGDIPEDSADEQLEEKLEEVEADLNDAFDESQSDEEELSEDIEDEFQDAIDDLTGNTESEDEEEETDPDENEEGEESEGEDEDGEGNPNEEDKNANVIDGNTSYIEYLEQLKTSAYIRLQDSSLTNDERNVLENYIKMIDAEIADKTNN